MPFHETVYHVDHVALPGDLIFIEHKGNVFYKHAEENDLGNVVTIVDNGPDAVVGPPGWIQAITASEVREYTPVERRRRSWKKLRLKY